MEISHYRNPQAGSYLPGRIWIWCKALLLVACALPSTGFCSGDLRLQFNPGLEHVVCEKIDHSRESLAIEMYDLSGKAVLSRLEAAKKRGVAIRVILCPTQESNVKTAETLRDASVDVRWYPVTKPGEKMHLKMGIVDNRLLILGSPNWTHTGLNLNHEGLFLVISPREVRQAQMQFESDWESSTSVCPATVPDDHFGEDENKPMRKTNGAGYGARYSRNKLRSQSPAKQKSGSKL